MERKGDIATKTDLWRPDWPDFLLEAFWINIYGYLYGNFWVPVNTDGYPRIPLLEKLLRDRHSTLNALHVLGGARSPLVHGAFAWQVQHLVAPAPAAQSECCTMPRQAARLPRKSQGGALRLQGSQSAAPATQKPQMHNVNCVTWVVWVGVCRLSCVTHIFVWGALCKLRCVSWVVQVEACKLGCVSWVVQVDVWVELCELSCVSWGVPVELCRLSCVGWAV